MTPWGAIGRVLIVTGVVLVLVGVLVTVAGRLPRLPGDVVIERPALTIYLPLGTMLLLSLLLTLVLALFRR